MGNRALVLTAESLAASARLCAPAGLRDYLSKPHPFPADDDEPLKVTGVEAKTVVSVRRPTRSPKKGPLEWPPELS